MDKEKEKELFEVLLEDIQGKFELVLATYEGLRKELKGEIREVREELHEKYNMTAFLIERLEQKVDKKIDALDQKFDKKIDALDQKFDKKIDALEQKLDEKTDALDQKIDDRTEMLGQKIDNVAAALAEHRADTEIHKGYTVYEK